MVHEKGLAMVLRFGLVVSLGFLMIFGTVAGVGCIAGPAHAETLETETAALGDLAGALKLDQLFEVLRAEGLAYGETLEADMAVENGLGFWTGAVSAIYDEETLRARFDAALAAELGDDPAAVAEVLVFLTSDLGQRVVGLDIEARRTFLDIASEEAARVAADDRTVERDPLVKQLRRIIDAGDLLEMNVAAAMSANLAFMTGMSDSGIYGDGMPQEDILADVWAEESNLRDSSNLWLHAFLGLAYAPLSEVEMKAYVDFVESPAGHRLNGALYAAYGAVYRQVNYELGRATGIALQSNAI